MNIARQVVVYAYAKILILKQITTYNMAFRIGSCCICLCKDTNFKANHNIFEAFFHRCHVVYAYAKILILKQITTKALGICVIGGLYMPMQRY